MAQKKHKKRHSQDVMNAKRQARESQMAKERDRNRMNPTARTLLFGDLVFLAVVSLMDRTGILSPTASGICTLIGIVLMVLALWHQFGGGSRDNR